jgi:hypothetical protein
MKYIGKMAETESLLSTCCTVVLDLVTKMYRHSHLYLETSNFPFILYIKLQFLKSYPKVNSCLILIQNIMNKNRILQRFDPILQTKNIENTKVKHKTEFISHRK